MLVDEEESINVPLPFFDCIRVHLTESRMKNKNHIDRGESQFFCPYICAHVDVLAMSGSILDTEKKE